MHLPKFLLATLTVPAVNAWYIEMIAANYNARGAFTYDNGNVYIDRDFNDGCDNRRLPGLVYLFRDEWLRGNGPDQSQGAMYYYRWEPTECTWPARRDASVLEGNFSAPLVEPSLPGPEFEPFILNSAAQ